MDGSRDSARIELLLDLFNVFNDTAEDLATDDLFSTNFGRVRRCAARNGGVRLYLAGMTID